ATNGQRKAGTRTRSRRPPGVPTIPPRCHATKFATAKFSKGFQQPDGENRTTSVGPLCFWRPRRATTFTAMCWWLTVDGWVDNRELGEARVKCSKVHLTSNSPHARRLQEQSTLRCMLLLAGTFAG